MPSGRDPMADQPGVLVSSAESPTAVMAAGHLFDHPPRADLVADFLNRPDHHLLVAYRDDGEPVGFITGIEVAHPDKPVEMLLYELGVDERNRRRGIGRTLVAALMDVARARGCAGMWVPFDPDNHAALATYRSAGAGEPTDATVLSWEFDPG